MRISDWRSDVCSSDLLIRAAHGGGRADEVTSAISSAVRSGLPEALAGRLSSRRVVVLLPVERVPAAAENRILSAFAELSPRIGHGDIHDLQLAASTLHSGAELWRFLTPAPATATGAARTTAAP